MLIDGTMAGLAQAMGLAVTDYDTVPVWASNSGGPRIRGRVRGPDGKGASFASLTLIDPRGQLAARTATGADGAFWLDAPTAGPYTLLVSSGPNAPATSPVMLLRGSVMDVIKQDTTRGSASSTSNASRQLLR
jgi:hypothetical protein